MASCVYQECPGNVHPGLENYYEYGYDPGDFLGAVLSNDLMKACSRADGYNQTALYGVVAWLYNNAPLGSYGSKEAYLAWLQSGGFEGRKRVTEAEEAEG